MKVMKKIIIATMLLLLVPCAAQARFRAGVKAGLGINKMKFNREILKSDNYLGYSVGVTAELEIPVIGVAFDASALFTHRTCEVYDNKDITYKRNYIEIPVHAKYKLNIMGLNRIVVPFVYAGPDFAFLASDKDPSNSFKNRSLSLALDFGAGVELFSHLQVSVNYSAGMTKAFEYVGINSEVRDVNGKDKCWTISAAYFF